MKRALALVGIGAALLVAGCKEKTADYTGGGPDSGNPSTPEPALATDADTVEGLAEEFVGQLEQLAGALRGVVDVKSAEKVAEITPLACSQFKAIATRLEYLELPSVETKAAINREMQQREEEMSRSLGDQEDFLNTLDPAARKIVSDAMDEFLQTMEQIQPVMEKYFLISEASATPPPAPPEPGPGPETEPAPDPAPLPDPAPEPEPAPEPAPVPAPDE